MLWTTLNLDRSVLVELERRQREEHKPLGQLASELLAQALARKPPAGPEETFDWVSAPMEARVHLEDHEAVGAALDKPVP